MRGKLPAPAIEYAQVPVREGITSRNAIIPLSILAIALGVIGTGISIFNLAVHRPSESAESLERTATIALSITGSIGNDSLFYGVIIHEIPNSE